MTRASLVLLTLPSVLFVANADAAGRRHRAARLVERTEIAENIIHYAYELRLGNGPFDTIGVHRVVERSDRRRGNSDGRRRDRRGPEHAVFLIHGAGGTFANAFLAGTLPSAETEDQSMAVFFAKQGIDVWGIDQAWSLVPFDVEDLSFMADWGLQRQIDEVSAALDFARWRRRDRAPMHVLGYSLGGVVGLALLNEGASLECEGRQVAGWIQFDTAPLNPAAMAAACEAAEAGDERLANGELRDPSIEVGVLIGTLALDDPDGPSPLAPGLTNRQFGLVVAAAPQPVPPPGATNPFYHLFAGVFDAQTGLPFDLTHVSPELAFEWLRTLRGGAPGKLLSEAAHQVCGDIELPFDDHLDDVTVPVLYVGADGGFGDAGIASTALLGSTDVTIELVDLVPNDRLLDYGHIDLAMASNAPFLAWEAIAAWIEDHGSSPCADDEDDEDEDEHTVRFRDVVFRRR